MKLAHISKAYNALGHAKRITGLTFGSIRNLLRLSQAIQPEIDFLNEHELAILNAFCDRKDGVPVLCDGQAVFTDPENAKQARKLLADLRNTEIEIELVPFVITNEELGGHLPVSAEDVEALASFVTFGGD